jgi:hypothetical protein
MTSPDPEANVCVRPGGKELKKYHRNFSKPRSEGLTKDGMLLYFARKQDCDAWALKQKYCPNIPADKIGLSIHEAAHDKARAIQRRLTQGAEEGRDAVCAPEAHPRTRQATSPGTERSQRRVPIGRHSPKSAETGEAHPSSQRRSSPHEAERPHFASPTAAPTAHRGCPNRGFFNIG